MTMMFKRWTDEEPDKERKILIFHKNDSDRVAVCQYFDDEEPFWIDMTNEEIVEDSFVTSDDDWSRIMWTYWEN